MAKIIITGSKGRMGQALIACAKHFHDLEIVGQIDQGDDLAAVIDQGDVVIDFSAHYVDAIAEPCAETKRRSSSAPPATRTPIQFDITKIIANIPDRLGVEFFHRRQHAVLAHAQGGGNSRSELRS